MTVSIPGAASFATFDPVTSTFTFNPTSNSFIKSWTISIKLEDPDRNSRTYSLTVNVAASSPPYYVSAPVTYAPRTVPINSSVNVPIFAYADPDGLAADVIVIC